LPLRKLGKGSFGDVYLIRHKKTGILYAMKTLRKKNNLEIVSRGNSKLSKKNGSCPSRFIR
jgi:serine/threonine protein kinase